MPGVEVRGVAVVRIDPHDDQAGTGYGSSEAGGKFSTTTAQKHKGHANVKNGTK